MKFLLPIVIILMCSSMSLAQESASGKVLGEIIESNPEYPGGMEQFFVYIRKNNNIEGAGKVFVTFFVEPDGEITEASIVKGVSEEVDGKVLELINNMPKWKPAMYQGNPVRKKMVLPIDI